MLLFLMDVDFGCDWILIQIFCALQFIGRDADACNQHSWHHTSHIQIFKLLIVHWSMWAWFLYVWDLLQLFEKWRLDISWCLTAYQDHSTVFAQSQRIFVPWKVERFVLIVGQVWIRVEVLVFVFLDVIKLEIVEWIRCSGYPNCRNKVLRRIHSSWNNDQLEDSLKARSSMVMIKDLL